MFTIPYRGTTANQLENTMSVYQFKMAPRRPESIAPADWRREWEGLEVDTDLNFAARFGYLAIDPFRDKFDTKTLQRRRLLASEMMDHVTDSYKDFVWVSRRALCEACAQAAQRRDLILTWLEEDDQINREWFMVPRYMLDRVE